MESLAAKLFNGNIGKLQENISESFGTTVKFYDDPNVEQKLKEFCHDFEILKTGHVAGFYQSIEEFSLALERIRPSGNKAIKFCWDSCLICSSDTVQTTKVGNCGFDELL